MRTYTEQNESYMGSRAGDALKQEHPDRRSSFAGPAAAAAATPVTVAALGNDPARHLATRPTFGATPKLIADIKQIGIDQWLRNQLAPETIAPTRARAEAGRADHRQADPTSSAPSATAQRARRRTRRRRSWRPRSPARSGPTGRSSRSWSTSGTTSCTWPRTSTGARAYRPSFDNDVIRKYALDNYPDMLVAANRHPALLLYLDQDQSRKDAVNENLARENLELFSVGVDGGYTESDVRQAALLQTGRSVNDDKYVYRNDQHYVGPVKIMGFSHANATEPGGRRRGDRGVLPVHRAAPVDREVHRAEPGHPVRLGHPAEDPGGPGRRGVPGQQGPDQADADHAVQLHRVLGLGGAEGAPPDGVPGRHVPDAGRAPEASPGFQNSNANAPRSRRGCARSSDKMEELGQFPTGQPTPNGYPDVFVAWTSAGTMVNGWNEADDIIDGYRNAVHLPAAGAAGRRPPAGHRRGLCGRAGPAPGPPEADRPGEGR